VSGLPTIALDELMARNSGSVDPSRFPNEAFDLYSIPAFDNGRPELSLGCEIGSSKQVVHPNDVLLSRIVPHIRRAWVVGEQRGYRQIASGEWIVFRSAKAHPSYLRYLLVEDRFHTQFMNTVAGVGGSLLRARPAQVADIEVSLPSLSEQRQIAGRLEQADRLRATRRYALDLSAAFLPAAFLELFGSPFTAVKRFPLSKLGEVAGFVDYRGIAPNKTAKGVRLVTARNIKRGHFEIEPQEFIPAEEYEDWMRRGMPRPGDVLFTTEGHTLGSAAKLPSFKRVALAQRLIALQPGKEISSDYLLYFVLSPLFQDQVVKHSTGSAARGISSKNLADLPIPLPPQSLQKEFARLATRIERLRAVQQEALRQAEHLFQSLLHDAFGTETIHDQSKAHHV
jgi:type I restriction enzyme S subunit